MNWAKFKKEYFRGFYSYWTFCANWLIGLSWWKGDNRIPEDQHLSGGAAGPSGFKFAVLVSQGTPS